MAAIPTESDAFDIIIIGAGINGAGMARDAALRGLRVLLLDKGDIASGTTGWSTRLIHGGLRYLEHYEFGLVRESLRERERLLRNAPHLVKPLPLILPIYRGTKRGPALIRAGMVLYDLLSFDKSLERHTMLDTDATLQRAPGLDRAGLRGGARYFDAQVTFPERIVVESAIDAVAHGAHLRTYMRVDRLVTEGRVVRGVEATDLRTGETVGFAGRVVINVAGPWVDEVLAGAPAAARPDRLIGGTRGSHIVVEPFPGAPAEALYYETRTDGRPVFIVPWNRMYLIGTTDHRHDGSLDGVTATEEEIAYLVAETNRLIPAAGLTREDVLYTYSGIRPLPYKPDGREAEISRSHMIKDHAPVVRGLLSIIGGKLTTYRNLSEETIDAACKMLGVTTRGRTAAMPLPGAAGGDLDALRERLARTSGLPKSTVARLVSLYGSRIELLLSLVAYEPELGAVIDPESGALAAEIVFAFRDEGAVTLEDALMRRTMIGFGPLMAVGADVAATQVAVRHLGWDEARAAAEVAAYRAHLARYTPRSLAKANARPA